MIRVWRGHEPWELTRCRERLLPLVEVKAQKGVEIQRADMDYSAARDSLGVDQHWKCAYCEMIPRTSTVEHVRPAFAAKGAGQPAVAPTGYWWLGMTWDNLLYVCDPCNRKKGDRFPLQPGSTRLSVRQSPPGAERIDWLDPGCEDPTKHICFFPDGPVWPAGEGKWRPTAREGSSRGEYTLSLGLDDDAAYFGRLDRHVERVVLPAVQAVQAAQSVSAQEVATAWSSACRLLEPEEEFVLLTYDVLFYYFSIEIAAAKLILPRPWTQPPSTPKRSRSPQEVLIAALPDTVQGELARLHKHSDLPEKRKVISSICRHRPSTKEELACLLGVGDRTVRDYIRGMNGVEQLEEREGRWHVLSV